MYLPTFNVFGLVNDNGVDRKKLVSITTNDKTRARAMFLGKNPEARILWIKKQEA